MNGNKTLELKYLFEDPADPSFDGLPDYTTLDFLSGGNHIYGEIMWSSGEFKGRRPCVIMLHGFPGSARNDDISHALCRIGCVVIVPHHRGAWGSQGKYLISNCIQDAENLAEFARSEEFCKKYSVDPDNIYLLGHSMGANSALNAGKNISWLRGIIMLTPYDPARYISCGKEEYFRHLLQEGKILQSDGIDAIYNDVVENRDNLSFPSAAENLKDKNILVFGATYDSVSPIEEMVEPLRKALEPLKTDFIRRFINYPTEHGLLGRRISVIRETAEFILDTIKNK